LEHWIAPESPTSICCAGSGIDPFDSCKFAHKERIIPIGCIIRMAPLYTDIWSYTGSLCIAGWWLVFSKKLNVVALSFFSSLSSWSIRILSVVESFRNPITVPRGEELCFRRSFSKSSVLFFKCTFCIC
jgi:hypothetical protein